MRTVKERRQATDAGLAQESECMNTIEHCKNCFLPVCFDWV